MSFALGLVLNGLAIVARVYSWPNPVRGVLSFVGMATFAALAGALWYYTEHLLKRPDSAAQIALGRSKALALFFLGAVTAVVAQVALIAISIRIGGIS
ncbi:MAG: hypothetical protein ACK4X1_17780 [Terricaulis sp.]